MYENEIIVVDDFFPKYIQKQILLKFDDGNLQWTYNKFVTFGYTNNKFVSNLKSYNDSIMDTDAFISRLDKDSEENKELKNNLENFIKAKFNITVSEILRWMFVYNPPDPNLPDNFRLPSHVDFDNLSQTNFLYYINDNDAPTLFFNQKKEKFKKSDDEILAKQEIIKQVYPKQGRAVLFNGLIYHAGNVSKYNKRLTMNLNFKSQDQIT